MFSVLLGGSERFPLNHGSAVRPNIPRISRRRTSTICLTGNTILGALVSMPRSYCRVERVCTASLGGWGSRRASHQWVAICYVVCSCVYGCVTTAVSLGRLSCYVCGGRFFFYRCSSRCSRCAFDGHPLVLEKNVLATAGVHPVAPAECRCLLYWPFHHDVA